MSLVREAQTDISVLALSGSLISQLYDASGTLRTDLELQDYNASGSIVTLISDVSGSLITTLYSTSGTLVSYTDTQVSAVSGSVITQLYSASGTLDTQIGSVITQLYSASGTLDTQIYTTSGALVSLMETGYNITPYSGYVDATFARITAVEALSGDINTLSGVLTDYIDDSIWTGSSAKIESVYLGGLGGEIGSGWYDFSLENLGENHPVNGVTGAVVFPTQSGFLLNNATLDVNGFEYHLDYWIDTNGETQAGLYGILTSSGGYSLDFSGCVSSVKMLWNYNSDTYAGFDLNYDDNIVFKYYI